MHNNGDNGRCLGKGGLCLNKLNLSAEKSNFCYKFTYFFICLLIPLFCQTSICTKKGPILFLPLSPPALPSLPHFPSDNINLAPSISITLYNLWYYLSPITLSSLGPELSDMYLEVRWNPPGLRTPIGGAFGKCGVVPDWHE